MGWHPLLGGDRLPVGIPKVVWKRTIDVRGVGMPQAAPGAVNGRLLLKCAAPAALRPSARPSSTVGLANGAVCRQSIETRRDTVLNAT
jgi:hypothetical protein